LNSTILEVYKIIIKRPIKSRYFLGGILSIHNNFLVTVEMLCIILKKFRCKKADDFILMDLRRTPFLNRSCPGIRFL